MEATPTPPAGGAIRFTRIDHAATAVTYEFPAGHWPEPAQVAVIISPPPDTPHGYCIMTFPAIGDLLADMEFSTPLFSPADAPTLPYMMGRSAKEWPTYDRVQFVLAEELARVDPPALLAAVTELQPQLERFGHVQPTN